MTFHFQHVRKFIWQLQQLSKNIIYWYWKCVSTKFQRKFFSENHSCAKYEIIAKLEKDVVILNEELRQAVARNIHIQAQLVENYTGKKIDVVYDLVLPELVMEEEEVSYSVYIEKNVQFRFTSFLRWTIKSIFSSNSNFLLKCAVLLQL